MANQNKDGDKDGKNVCDIYATSRAEDIGTIVDPKASDEVITFVKENVLGTTPFAAVLDNPTRHSECLARKDALLQVSSCKQFAAELAVGRPPVDKKSSECLRTMYHDFLREVRVLMQMYEAARTQGPAINADAYYRANGATANAMRMTGLSTFLSHGEPTAVSRLVVANKATHAKALAEATPAPAPTGHAPVHHEQNARVRPRDNGPQRQCGYCAKIGHDAALCRQRMRDDSARLARPAPAPTVETDTAKLLAAVLKALGGDPK